MAPFPTGVWRIMMSSGANPAIGIPAERSIRALVRRILVPSRRFVSVGFLSLALLAPFFGGVLPLLQDTASSCGMSCCSDAKSCCCHLHKPASQAGSLLTAAPVCQGGCDQRVGLPGSIVVALVPGSIAVGQVAPIQVIQDYAAPTHRGTDFDFALFGRPPPSSF